MIELLRAPNTYTRAREHLYLFMYVGAHVGVCVEVHAICKELHHNLILFNKHKLQRFSPVSLLNNS